MTSGRPETDTTGEDQLLDELYPQITEHLAARYAEDDDPEAGRARFTAWLSEHTDDGNGDLPASAAEPDPSIHVNGDVQIHTGQETAASPTAMLNLLIEREQAARRDRIQAGQRVLAAMIGFAVITSVTLAFTPHFGVPLVVATTILAGLVAAAAIRAQPPSGGGSTHSELLLDLARSTLPRPETPQPPHSGRDDDKPAEPAPSDTTPTVATQMPSLLVPPHPPLTPADVRNKQFSTTRLRPGYDEEEVDAFLDEVDAELDRLIQENEELRARLAESLHGGKSSVPALSLPLAESKMDMMQPEPSREPERRQPEPVMMGSMAPAEDNMDIAAQVLSLAQQTADQAIADARREADDILASARDARSRAESLERDAKERHRQAMGSLVQQREELERRVDDLRALEREYRSRLKAYLEGQLRDLEAGVTDSGTFPTMNSMPQTREELERRVDDLRVFEREYRSRLKAYLEGQLRDLEAGVTDSGTFPTMNSTPQLPMPGTQGQSAGCYGEDPGAGQYDVPEAMEHSGGLPF